jgi:EAL domain-containing protein (putative c-di-GMP-specific phosphodiesterase class I)
MALDMQATVVAEGVETPAELSCVSGLGVDQAQGYLIGRPTTDLDLIDALRQDVARSSPPYPDLVVGPSPQLEAYCRGATRRSL